MLSVYLVDDEALALRRLERMLGATRRVRMAGSSTDPAQALSHLAQNTVDALFLDIQMNGMSGFDLLARLDAPPPVVFTTAFDSYALGAFHVDSVDYLMKPVTDEDLHRALDRIERRRATVGKDTPGLAKAIAAELGRRRPHRLASRVGHRLVFIEVDAITHVVSRNRQVFAITAQGEHLLDQSIEELERSLDQNRFVRIHRAILVNLEHVAELCGWFSGSLTVRLKDAKSTDLAVARDRVRNLKARLRE